MRAATLLFSPLSRIVCRIKRRLYETGRLRSVSCPVPAVGVGNIAFGGSGKTPLAMELLSLFLSAGAKPAFVSRGYRGRWEKSGGVLSDGRNLRGTWRDGGDEPYMVARAFPQVGVYVGRDRPASCRRAADDGFDIAVLDDAFQHLRLRRDIDIVIDNAAAGRSLREGRRALDRADIILVSSGSGDRIDCLRQEHPRSGVYSCTPEARSFIRFRDGAALPLDALHGRRVLAVCGIARPERFFRFLESAGAEIAGRLAFPDHHAYPGASFRIIRRAAARLKPEAVVTTEKDVFKLAGLGDEAGEAPLYALRIGLDLDPEFRSRILSFIGGAPGKPGGGS